jgi:hypothetical protein
MPDSWDVTDSVAFVSSFFEDGFRHDDGCCAVVLACEDGLRSLRFYLIDVEVVRSIRCECPRRDEAARQSTGRMFIAFSFKQLAILSWVCFNDDSNASTEEVHMKIHVTKRQMLNVCATAAAADTRALLG